MSPEKSSQNGPAASPRRTAAPWWEQRSTAIALILLSAVPLLYPPIPPLVDLLGHMGRYRVELDLATSPWLQQYFGFHWAVIGNLGVDLLVVPLAKLFGLELGGEADRAGDPAADRRRLAVGRARGARPHSADRAVRAAVRLQPSVPVRLRQFRAVDGAWRSSPSRCGCGSAGWAGRGCARSCSCRSR